MRSGDEPAIFFVIFFYSLLLSLEALTVKTLYPFSHPNVRSPENGQLLFYESNIALLNKVSVYESQLFILTVNFISCTDIGARKCQLLSSWGKYLKFHLFFLFLTWNVFRTAEQKLNRFNLYVACKWLKL